MIDVTMVEVYIDFRETSLHNELQEYITKHGMNMSIITDNLAVGDILVKSGNGTSMIFERKTVADLAASIKDGRYKEQKCRLLASYPAHRITYIIEGGGIFMEDCHGLSGITYEGFCMNSMYRDGIHVIYVRNVAETARWIANLARRCNDNGDKFATSTLPLSEYHHQCKVKTRKVDNITPSTCYLLQLCQIPGVSQKIAEIIQQAYPSFPCLISSLAASPSPEVELAKLSLIGSKKAKTICTYILNT